MRQFFIVAFLFAAPTLAFAEPPSRLTASAPIAATAAANASVPGASPSRGEAVLAPAFSGTIVSTYPNGLKVRVWLSEDGGFTARGRWGARYSGRWNIKHDQLCFRRSGFLVSLFSYCTPLPKTQTTTWSATAVTGEPVTVTIEPGGRPG